METCRLGFDIDLRLYYFGKFAFADGYFEYVDVEDVAAVDET